MAPVCRSRLEALHSPAASGAFVAHPVVQAPDARLPQLQGQRPDAVAAPPRRKRHLAVAVASGDLRHPLLQLATTGDGLALGRRPRTQLAVARPGAEVLDRLGPA